MSDSSHVPQPREGAGERESLFASRIGAIVSAGNIVIATVAFVLATSVLQYDLSVLFTVGGVIVGGVIVGRGRRRSRGWRPVRGIPASQRFQSL